MLTMNIISFAATLLLLSRATVSAAPMPVSSQIEILRISGVSEREIEHKLNPNHALASAHESTIPTTAAPFTSPQQLILSALAAPEPEFAATIDGYSTAKSLPGSTASTSSSGSSSTHEGVLDNHSSLSAFEKVRRWMSRRGDGSDDDLVVTGRMGDIKIRGRR